MKISIYELLGLIKDGKAPERILFGCSELLWLESEEEYIGDGFEHLNLHMMLDNLNDEVEILDEPKEDKIGKLEFDFKMIDETDFVNKYPRISYMIETQKNMINKIIDEINKLKVNNEPR